MWARIALFLTVLALLACSRDPSPFGQELSIGRSSQGDPLVERFELEVEDTYFEYLPNTSGWDDLPLGKWMDHEQRLLLGFEDLPEDAVHVDEAELTLTITRDFLDGALDVKLYEIGRSWVDDEVTWTNASTDSLWAAEGGDFGSEIGSGTISAGDSTVTFQLNTSIVNDWLQEEAEFRGIAIVPDGEGGAFAVENETDTDKALLYIEYIASGGSTVTVEERQSRSASIGETTLEPADDEGTILIGNVDGFARRAFVTLSVDSIPADITVARAVLRFRVDQDATDTDDIESLKLWRVCGDYEGADTELCSGSPDISSYTAGEDSVDVTIGQFGDFLGEGGDEPLFVIGASSQEILAGHVGLFTSDAAGSLRPALFLTYTVPPGSPWP